jgi:hypothetical protein
MQQPYAQLFFQHVNAARYLHRPDIELAPCSRQAAGASHRHKNPYVG